jgi:hypothetical protein
MKHRPECPSGDAKWKRAEAPLYGLLCICDRLEECEQRVRDELFPLRWGRAEQLETARVNGWHAGWNAAREAVESMVIETAGNSAATVNQAVAAIDALRDKP